jgi:hypothetical protein
MRKLSSLLLLLLLPLVQLVPVANAQTVQSLVKADTTPTQVVVTFAFQSALADYSVYAGEGGEQRFYIEVPTSNIPSYTVTPRGVPLKVMVDNDKSSDSRLVFWVPLQRGTSPRIDRSQAGLSITFTPPQAAPEAGREGPASASTAQPTTALSAAPVSPAPQATPPGFVMPTELEFKADAHVLPTANVDLSVPESPAFTVLGLTPETVVRPSSPREFASALLSGVDRNGNFQSGTALDTVPYLLLAGKGLTLGAYRSNYKLRLASRTQFSFATTKGASDDDKSARLALGFRMTLWDKGDPRMDRVLMGCFTTVQRAFFASTAPPGILPPDQLPPTATAEDRRESEQAWETFRLKEIQANETRNQGNEQCRENSRKQNWNKSSWIVAFAPSWISETGQTKNFKWNGAGFWTSLAYGFEGFPGLQKHSQLIVHARYRDNEKVPDPDNEGKFFDQDSFFLGSRLRVGNENATGSFEGVFVRSRPAGKGWDNSARYSLGLERRVAENLWFALAFGGENGRDDGKNNGFVLSSFRWGFSRKRNFDTSPTR